MSGYILFSSEMRAVIKAQHPDYSFGELSRLVGTEWRNLEASKKAEYEGKIKLQWLKGFSSLPFQRGEVSLRAAKCKRKKMLYFCLRNFKCIPKNLYYNELKELVVVEKPLATVMYCHKELWQAEKPGVHVGPRKGVVLAREGSNKSKANGQCRKIGSSPQD